MAIDPKTLDYQYRRSAGSDSDNQKSTYGIEFSSGGNNYTFIPTSVINKGANVGENTFVLPWFLKQENLDQLGKTGQYVDLAKQSWYGDYLKDSVGASTDGFLVPSGSLDFDSEVKVLKEGVKGLGNTKEGLAYILDTPEGKVGRYLPSDGKITTLTQTRGSSLLGRTFGSWVDDFTTSTGIADIAGGVNDFFQTDVGKALKLASLASGAYNLATAPDPNAVGGVTGPDNIDVGGGFNPGAAPPIDSLAASYYGLPEGSQYVAPKVTDLGTVAGTTEGMAATPEVAGMGGAQGLTAPSGTNLAQMGGGQGLQSGVGTNLADMGGAQGLTTAGAAGGVLGAAGLTAGSGATAAGIGTGLGLSPAASGTGSLLTGAAAGAPLAAGAGTLTGSALGDMAAINAGAGAIGGLLQSNAATEAAQIQAAAADRAIAAQQKNFETINAQQAPYRAAGYTSLNNIANLTSGQTPQYDASGNVVRDANGNPVMTTGSGYFQKQFDANDLKSGLAPNYDFMLGQGQMANQRAANMGGGALGGNALQGLNRFTQDYAGNAYQNAFNNFQTQRGNIYNTLAGIAGIGQTGQNATNTAAANTTNAVTQLGVGAAGAQAAGTVGSANAYTNAINNATNNYTLASLLNQRGNVQMPIG